MATKADVQQVLDGVHESLLALIQHLEGASATLDTVDEQDLQSFVDTHTRAAREAYERQLHLWQRISSSAQQAELATLHDEVQAIGSSKKAPSLKERLAAMGATPALGNGMPLPKTSGQQRSNLHVNASPVSREMFLSKHGVELRTPGGGGTPSGSPAPWMEELKLKKVSSAVHTPQSVNKDLTSELGAVLAARAHKQGERTVDAEGSSN